MDERVFYRETNTTHTMELNCPYCRSMESYELQYRVRLRKDQMPQGGDEMDRARFAKALSYMVLMDDKVACKNNYCRKRFDVSGIKTTSFLSPEQEETFRKQKPVSSGRPQRGSQGGRGQRQGGERGGGNRQGGERGGGNWQGNRGQGGRGGGPHGRRGGGPGGGGRGGRGGGRGGNR